MSANTCLEQSIWPKYWKLKQPFPKTIISVCSTVCMLSSICFRNHYAGCGLKWIYHITRNNHVGLFTFLILFHLIHLSYCNQTVNFFNRTSLQFEYRYDKQLNHPHVWSVSTGILKKPLYCLPIWELEYLFIYFLAFQGKVPMFSLEALHQLHIFIFVLAIVHVVFCVLTMILGGARVNDLNCLVYCQFSSLIIYCDLWVVTIWIFEAFLFLFMIQIRQWKHWEDAIAQEKYDTDKGNVLHCLTLQHNVSFVNCWVLDH